MSTYGLLGYPLAVSFSPAYFSDKFRKLGVDHQYLLFPREEVADLRSWIEANSELVGLNVTIPHKQAVLPVLDDLTPEAQAAGAVNTIRIERNPLRLIGHNTDVVGFRETLLSFLGDARPPALVLGTGGAAHAVWYALQQLGIPFIKAGRNACDGVLAYGDLTPDLLSSSQLWINTTPLGMEPTYAGQMPPLPYECIVGGHYLYDLVYHPVETPFLAAGRLRGAETQNGLAMLHAQADASWLFWEA